MKQTNWDQPTRWLHFGLAVSVTLQLLLSLVMEPGNQAGTSILAKDAFKLHEVFGITAFFIVLAHWMWSVHSNDKERSLAHLFPFSKTGRQQIIDDVGSLRRGVLPEGGNGGLAGMVHGLGLLAVSGISLSGVLLFIFMPSTGPLDPFSHLLKAMHQAIAVLVWSYWLGHIAMALLHHYRGENTLRVMFALQSTSTDHHRRQHGQHSN